MYIICAQLQYYYTVLSSYIMLYTYIGADWGLDSLFCLSATHYALTHLNYPSRTTTIRPPRRTTYLTSTNAKRPRFTMVHPNMDYSTTISLMQHDQKITQSELISYYKEKVINLTLSPVCTLLISSDPIHHSNSKLVNHMIGGDLKVDLNMGMLEILAYAYPQWFQGGHVPISDPLSGSVEYMMLETRHVNMSSSSSDGCRRARVAG